MARRARKTCAWCQEKEVSPRATYCSPACQRQAYRDRTYYGGQLRDAVGYHDRSCWACGKTGLKRVHPHHVYGHALGDAPLVCLCPGCHQIVSLLARRAGLLEHADKVAHLITLARMQALLTDASTEVLYRR